MRLGALEAGGTKMVCAIGDENGKIREQVSIPTTTPEETMPKIADYFRDKQIDALGIACFGPVELDRNDPKYGYITSTSKLSWIDSDFAGRLQRELHCPVGFDTDVNGSVLGEVTFGQAKGKNCVLYLTVGTGVGGGIYCNGSLLHGMMHPEAGHVLIRKRADDTYEGKCPYHKTCLEGLAAGPAIEARWGKGRGIKGQSGGLGAGSRLSGAGHCGLHYGHLSGDGNSGRRRYASGAAVPLNPQESNGICGGLCEDGRIKRHGAFYCTGIVA